MVSGPRFFLAEGYPVFLSKVVSRGYPSPITGPAHMGTPGQGTPLSQNRVTPPPPDRKVSDCKSRRRIFS